MLYFVRNRHVVKQHKRLSLVIIVSLNVVAEIMLAAYLAVLGLTTTGVDSGFITGLILLLAIGLVADVVIVAYLSWRHVATLSVYYIVTRLSVAALSGAYEMLTLLSDSELNAAFSIGYAAIYIGIGVFFSISSFVLTKLTGSGKKLSWTFFVIFIMLAVGVLISLRITLQASSENPGTGLAGKLRDEHTEQSVHILQNSISSYYVLNNKAPQSINALNLDHDDLSRVTKDRISYIQESGADYKLCATFFTVSVRPIYSHEAGDSCLVFTYDSAGASSYRPANAGASIRVVNP